MSMFLTEVWEFIFIIGHCKFKPKPQCLEHIQLKKKTVFAPKYSQWEFFIIRKMDHQVLFMNMLSGFFKRGIEADDCTDAIIINWQVFYASLMPGKTQER